MSATTKHTATPWVFRAIKKPGNGCYGYYNIHSASKRIIAVQGEHVSIAQKFKDAAFIVRACNAHDALTVQCSLFAATISDLIKKDEINGDIEGANLKRHSLSVLQTVLARASGKA